jgi:hypothetical protein
MVGIFLFMRGKVMEPSLGIHHGPYWPQLKVNKAATFAENKGSVDPKDTYIDLSHQRITQMVR